MFLRLYLICTIIDILASCVVCLFVLPVVMFGLFGCCYFGLFCVVWVGFVLFGGDLVNFACCRF